MTFTEILESEETSPKEKLAQLATLVKDIRTKYGNTEVEIPSGMAATTEGCTPMAMLNNESRLAVAQKELERIITITYEDTQTAIGINYDRRLEEYIAINPILNSIEADLGSSYL